MSYQRKREFPLRSVIIILIIIVVIITVFPTPRDGIVDEPYYEEMLVLTNDLKKRINCKDIEIKNGETEDWSYTELGELLRVVIDIASTKVLILSVESKSKIEIDEKDSIFHYNETMDGPSLVIKLINPLMDFGGKAELSGSILIYHEYYKTVQIKNTRQVNGTVWKPWWMD